MKRALFLAALLAAATPAVVYAAAQVMPRAAVDVREKSKQWPSPQGESWDAIKKLPDFGGVWSAPLPGQDGPRAPPNPVPSYTPAAAAKLKAFNDSKARGENTQTDKANCTPFAFPSSMGIYPIEFLFTPGKVTVAIETDSQMRRIYTDGRPLTDDPDPTFQGTSVGHWEGDTLVTETVGLVPAPQMEIVAGVGHGDKLRIREKIRLVAKDQLQVEWTYEDPDVLTKPWTTTRIYLRHRDWDIPEYNCAQNNHDAADDKGRPSMRLDK